MKKCIIVLLGICLMFTACNNGGGKQTGPSHYPFKESKKDRWGLVDANGKALVSNEFKNQPTVVINDVFFVEQDNGFEMYSAKNPLLPVGDVYKSIAPFTDRITPCVKEGEGIKFIDKEGKIKYELPLDFTYATNFINGYSLVTKKDEGGVLRGTFSLSGETLFFPEFIILKVLSDGTLLANKTDSNDDGMYLIDNQGKIKTDLQSEKVVLSNDEKYYLYYEDGNYGLRTIEGQNVIRAKYPILAFTDDGNLIFADDDEKCGIMNLKGDVLVKPRYSMIVGCKDGVFIASKDGESFGLLNMKEERIIDFEYSGLFFIPNSKNLYAIKERDNYVYIIDRKNNEIADFSQLEIGEHLWYYSLLNEQSEYSSVKSDYFDVTDCIKSLFFPSGKTIDDLYGFAGMAPGDCANRMGVSLSKDDINDNNNWFPYQFLEQNEYGNISYSLGFSKVVETYYDDDDYWQIRPRYGYSNEPCGGIRAMLKLNYDARNHIGQIKKQLEEVILGLGYTKSGTSSSGDQKYMKPGVEIDMIYADDEELFVKVFHQ